MNHPRTKQSSIPKITLRCRNLVADHHLFLQRSPLNMTMTNYIRNDIRELDHHVLHWGDFTHTSCTAPPNPRKRQLKISKITSLRIKLVAGHHLFLHRIHLMWLLLTNYINSDIIELDLHILHWGDFTHTACTAPHYTRTTQLKNSKITSLCRKLVADHHLLWLTTLTLRLENLTLVSSTEVILQTCYAPPKNKTKLNF